MRVICRFPKNTVTEQALHGIAGQRHDDAYTVLTDHETPAEREIAFEVKPDEAQDLAAKLKAVAGVAVRFA